MRRFVPLLVLACVAAPFAVLPSLGATAPQYDVVIRGGTIYDGTGGAPYQGDVAVKGDRIAAIAPHIDGHGQTEIDARGKAVSPGFINMLAHPEESLIADGRGLSDLQQGVTLEVMGEDSMGPLDARDEEAGRAAPERHQISDHLDDARRLSRHAAEEGHLAQCRVLRRRGHRAHQSSGRGRCAADARTARRDEGPRQAGDGRRRAGPDRRADLFAQHLRQDA